VKILVFGKIYPDSFAKNILVTLSAMGHDAWAVENPRFQTGHSIALLKLANYATAFFPQLNRWPYRSLLNQASDLCPDLVLMSGEQPPPAVIRELKQRVRTTVVQWFPDALSNFGRQYILAADYDAYFFKDEYIVQFMREKLGKRAYFLPQACNPIWHHRVDLTEKERQKYVCDLTVAGNLYWYRALMLEALLSYDVKIWGANVPRWLDSPTTRLYQHHYVAEEEKAKAFNAAKIVLNTMHYAEILGCNLRLFEAAGCGAFQIVDWRPNITKFLEPETEVVTFHTREELREKVDYYLSHDGERKVIADRAYARAHREHTYEHRLKKLLDLTFEANGDDD
jgi:spore maturation protein CgeB